MCLFLEENFFVDTQERFERDAMGIFRFSDFYLGTSSSLLARHLLLLHMDLLTVICWTRCAET